MPFTMVYSKSSSHIYDLFLYIEGKNYSVFDSYPWEFVFFENTYGKYKDHNLLSTHINRFILIILNSSSIYLIKSGFHV